MKCDSPLIPANTVGSKGGTNALDSVLDSTPSETSSTAQVNINTESSNKVNHYITKSGRTVKPRTIFDPSHV